MFSRVCSGLPRGSEAGWLWAGPKVWTGSSRDSAQEQHAAHARATGSPVAARVWVGAVASALEAA